MDQNLVEQNKNMSVPTTSFEECFTNYRFKRCEARNAVVLPTLRFVEQLKPALKQLIPTLKIAQTHSKTACTSSKTALRKNQTVEMKREKRELC